jgi:hypothetical protein
VLNCPELAFSTPLICNVPLKETPAEFEIVRFLTVLVENVLAGMVWADEPLSSMLPFTAVKVPLLLIDPAIVNAPPETVKDPPAARVRLFTEAVPELIIG